MVYIKKLPLNIVSKIPFEIRNNIAQKAQNCQMELSDIDTSAQLKDMSITADAKDILNSSYIYYLCDESSKDI